ncbi:hypothetical protein IQ238_19550 [Pleurocapsales cyanobacterium LEGE 06147]|nr:hypothetical protein [Pleurocapsales cyanobacterium LEGE 06147]
MRNIVWFILTDLLSVERKTNDRDAMIEVVDLWVPLALLGLIILAAIFFSKIK